MIQPTADEILIERLRQRDEGAVSLLYDKYAAALMGAIIRVVPNKAIAEEVLQDVFTKIWRNIEQYDTSKGKFYTWIVNIARNAAIDATRQKGYKRQNQDLENVVNTLDAQNSVSINPETLDIKELTNHLTSDYKILVDLVYFQGFTQAEAAEHLSMPLGTVKTRLRTAINKLKELF
jgi:RNA polymerase sigma factor (sigma-70 family)